MTFGKGLKSAEDTVSIHATLAGGDWFTFPLIEATTECFYPRHPRGWRHRQSTAWTGGTMFLSTPPSRVATTRTYWRAGSQAVFLSTPPSRVATYRYKTLFHTYHRLYPRHPRGWRHLDIYCGYFGSGVSIHATLAGGDPNIPHPLRGTKKFLSTPPSRVATICWTMRGRRQRVSIHATLAGGDISCLSMVAQ